MRGCRLRGFRMASHVCLSVSQAFQTEAGGEPARRSTWRAGLWRRLPPQGRQSGPNVRRGFSGARLNAISEEGYWRIPAIRFTDAHAKNANPSRPPRGLAWGLAARYIRRHARMALLTRLSPAVHPRGGALASVLAVNGPTLPDSRRRHSRRGRGHRVGPPSTQDANCPSARSVDA